LPSLPKAANEAKERNPFILFVIAPLFLFVVRQRFPSADANPRARSSVWIMDIAVICLGMGLISIFGFLPWLIIKMTTIGVAGTPGVRLFHAQHQFEDAYREHADSWDYTAAAMQGSSFYKLPEVLQWFAGNIGFHHIHHLSYRIPNYNLERCHRFDPMFVEVELRQPEITGLPPLG
jgi:omega-6 fatty acid desaturase (delta-12 desaturase)